MDDPKKYREEAERLRSKAEKSIDPKLQQTMLDIAAQYERLAKSIEASRDRGAHKGERQ
jgi:hypothetical protein